ncbi:ABC transporter substrate-binding protein [uncultured Enterovirga sp.]|uniref:ABC transporter substrate-binding protein n=1 Tax=uncultured Enterovirga sp. TaxID=2026352 RepID=UPI0035CC7119
MDRRQFLSGTTTLAALSLAGSQAFAQAAGAPEKASLKLGVGGRPLLYYLPLTVAERKGFFKEEGLTVEINDFGGGAKSLQSLIGGSVDVVTGAYEHTIRMQAKGQMIQAVCELGRFPAIAVAVRKEKAGEIKSPADFKGRRIGVTAPGSSTAILAQFAMVKAGLKPNDAAFIGIGGGAGAVAAMIKGEIDVISHLDPVIAKLEEDGLISTLIDTRTEAGTKALFGGSNPAAVVYLKSDFVSANPNTVQRLVNAHVKALKWLAAATPEQVADLVPTEYHLNDKPLYLKAVKNSLESYSRSGLVPQGGQESVLDMLRTIDPELAGAKIDLAQTFNGSFVRRATS